MIELTRLNGRPMVVNSDLIKTAEASPDTMLTLINGEKLIVREEISEVVERILVYRARLLAVVARRLHHFHDLERAGALVSPGTLQIVEMVQTPRHHRQQPRAIHQNPLHDLGDLFAHNQLFSVDQGQHRIRRSLGSLDQVAVDYHRPAVQPGQFDHRAISFAPVIGDSRQTLKKENKCNRTVPPRDTNDTSVKSVSTVPK